MGSSKKYNKSNDLNYYFSGVLEEHSNHFLSKKRARLAFGINKKCKNVPLENNSIPSILSINKKCTFLLLNLLIEN